MAENNQNNGGFILLKMFLICWGFAFVLMFFANAILIGINANAAQMVKQLASLFVPCIEYSFIASLLLVLFYGRKYQRFLQNRKKR